MKLPIKEGSKYILAYDLLSVHTHELVQYPKIKYGETPPLVDEFEVRREIEATMAARGEMAENMPHGHALMAMDGAEQSKGWSDGERYKSTGVIVNTIEWFNDNVARVIFVPIYRRYSPRDFFEFIVYDESEFNQPIYRNFITVKKLNECVLPLPKEVAKFQRQFFKQMNSAIVKRVKQSVIHDNLHNLSSNKRNNLTMSENQLHYSYFEFMNKMIDNYREEIAYKKEVKNYLKDGIGN